VFYFGHSGIIAQEVLTKLGCYAIIQHKVKSLKTKITKNLRKEDNTMSEQAPQQPVEYLQQHPDAVVDPAKAEIMAYASRGQEEAVVAARGLALEAASNIGNNSFRDSDNRGAHHAATHQAGLAEQARVEADKQAMQAGDIYDQVKGL